MLKTRNQLRVNNFYGLSSLLKLALGRVVLPFAAMLVSDRSVRHPAGDASAPLIGYGGYSVRAVSGILSSPVIYGAAESVDDQYDANK